MTELVWFTDKQGCGYITNQKNALRLSGTELVLAGETLKPGDMTTISGLFCRPLEYLGTRDPKEMIFYIGSMQDMFEVKHYFQSVLWVSETRVWESFAPGSGRDFNFIGGVWK